MPGLFVLLTGIVVYAITLDGAAEGLKYMLAVDPAKFNGGTVVAALDVYKRQVQHPAPRCGHNFLQTYFAVR